VLLHDYLDPKNHDPADAEVDVVRQPARAG